ncbi:MAG: hypothetical protein DMG23_11415 [Acidobacteria bacterium]|nr:MAG: hypothetical protein DMG23_11415 [Acidobacteriota bacterium]
MSGHISLGIALVLIGGFLNGSFAFPMKRLPAWRWENIWLAYSFSGMIFVPWITAAATVPHLAELYRQSSSLTLVKVTLFGLGWGVGSTLFGMGISRVGLALGFAVTLGITASFGSVLPLAVLHPEELLTHRGLALMAGTLVMVLGQIFLSIAGRRRERETGAATSGSPPSSFALGLVICIFSGIFSSMLNFAFLFGDELRQRALSAGASAPMAANPIWALAVTAGFLANAGYCAYLLSKHRTWSLFTASRSGPGPWLGAGLMGVIWFSGIAVYGMGGALLGALGGIVGWPIFMAMVILTGYLMGVVSGEWKGASRRSYSYSWLGVAILLVAIYIVSLGNAA